MDISNKTLGLLLIAAMVFSIGGSLFSVNKLDALSSTGFATSDQGSVNLSVNSSVSIAVVDSSIDFGTCTIPGGQTLTFDSSLAGTTLNNSNCTGGTFPDFINVTNDGNLDANVSVHLLGAFNTYVGSTTELYASTVNGVGCTGPHASWTQLVDGTYIGACDNLTTGAGTNEIKFYAQVKLSSDAANNGANSTTIEFYAEQTS